jgi:hypothetical protein
MVFASSSARDTALSSAKSEGMFAFLKDTDSLTYYDGSSWTAVDLAGDITGITTASNSSLAGGATSGTVTLTVDVNNTTSATATTSDYMLISDVDDSNATRKALISDVVSAGDITGVTAGTNISGGGSSGTVTVNLAIDAAVDAGSDGAGVDVTFHSDTAGDYAKWDSSEEKLILEGTNGATVLDITDGNVVIGDGTLTVGSDGAGEDVTFHSDTAGDAFVWDSSAEKLTITGTDSQTALDIADGNLSVTDTATVGTLTLDSAPATAWTDSNIVLAGQVFSG